MPTIGTAGCRCCAREIPVKENANGTLNFNCPWCDFSAYAKKGTEAHRKLGATVKRTEPEAPPASSSGADKGDKGKGGEAPPAKSGGGMPWMR